MYKSNFKTSLKDMFLAALFKDRYKNIDVEHKQRVDNL